MTAMAAHLLTWAIVLIATACVIARPFRWPEAIWAVGGAGLLVILGLLPVASAVRAVAKGNDVYLFLTGMMLLSEVARREGLFDWVATMAVNASHRSPARLFLLVYAVGTIVTVFLSNDATAVVLTPAVFAATRKARVEPLPYLFICAFIANAASFVLPISNPANLVLYGNHVPALGAWLPRFAVPSLGSIVATYIALRFTQSRRLGRQCEAALAQPMLSRDGATALLGICATAIVLMIVSAFDLSLGLPTALMGGLTALVIILQQRASPWPIVKDISWSVLPLVAGLFVLVEALGSTGVITALAGALRNAASASEVMTAAGAGGLIALASNLINNLPAGLIASALVDAAHATQRITDAVLIGVDLGPNLSITGSLATILWLTAIRRDGGNVSFVQFLKVGLVVMTPALSLALACRLLL